jgi:sigma-B regulation protein RsbU (phosphoserine phosphatase)
MTPSPGTFPTTHRPRPSARLQYALLALVAACGLIHVTLGYLRSYASLAHGTEQASIPFYFGTLSKSVRPTPAQARAASVPPDFLLVTLTVADKASNAAGLNVGDAVYTVAGRPLTSASILAQEVARRRPGQTLDVVFWSHAASLGAPPVHASILLAPLRRVRPPAWAWLLQSFFTLLPAFCLFTGIYVVFALPRNPHSWLVLGVLAYISALFLQGDQQIPYLLPITVLWRIVGQTAMAICFMLLGLYFPRRSPVDRRYPWIKWALIVPTLLLFPTDVLSDFGLLYRFTLVIPLLPLLKLINFAENSIFTLQIWYGFLALRSNVRDPATSPDSRRRLRILIVGCSIGLTPLFFLLAFSLLRGTDLGDGVPQWLALTVFALLFIFPLTLAYVVVVQRAMDLRILIRQGTKYFFARQSVLIVGILLATWMSIEISLAVINHGHRGPRDVTRLLAIIAIFIAYRRLGAKRMQRWIDQKFFREAYSTEQILSELSEEARNFTETAPLLETITRRLGETLHIDRIAIFLRSGDVFQLQFATGVALTPGFLPALPATSTTITHLTRPKAAPANVYRDDPSSWLVDATDQERTALADLSTELLVPLPGRNRLVGVIALGPKTSEEPYSRTDRQMLQTVASQTGLALENAELLENLTAELAQRASLHREIEIAREVQERLFPQTLPALPGVDLAGFCRPAQFVGGDYYDFFLIPQPANPTHPASSRLAIAIGDISGKGISAALLMASLRASLRSVATLQQPDGSSADHLATLMQHVNRLVYEASTSNRYATFFYAELDPATRILSYVNAGHNCPVILRPTGPESNEAIQLQPTGTVIGLLPDATYTQATIQLHPRDTLLAFTDGISEAMTAADDEWGEARMTAAAQSLLLQPGCTYTARQLLECILAEADAFTAGAPQHDDMTLLLCTLS